MVTNVDGAGETSVRHRNPLFRKCFGAGFAFGPQRVEPRGDARVRNQLSGSMIDVLCR